MTDLLKRSVSGCLYVVIMLAGVLLHPYVFVVVFALLLFFSQREFYMLMEKAGYAPQKYTGLITGALLFFICFGMVEGVVPQNAYLIFLPALIFLFLFEIFRDNPKVIQGSAVTITGILYVAVPFCLMNFIIFPAYPGGNPVFTPGILTGIFLVVWVYDSMAYLGGSLFGKHKIHEKISPQKSWEGFISGTVFALVMGALNAVIFQSPGLFNWLAMAFLTVIFGTLGDLFESKIKRKLKVKDSGSVLPGHGGLLDRFDSLLFVIPVIFVWLTFFGNF